MNRWVLLEGGGGGGGSCLTNCPGVAKGGGRGKGEKSTEGASFREPEAVAHRHFKKEIKLFKIYQMT